MDPVSIEQLIGASNPNDFVGRKNIINTYHEILREFVRGNSTVRWIHISGEAGIGKSSLLRKLRMDTELERVATGSVEIPISPNIADNFLYDIKRMLDEMAPEWRSFIQRRKNALVSGTLTPPESEGIEITDEYIDNLVDTFFEDLDKIDSAMKKERYKHGLFLDDLDRFLSYGYKSLLKIWGKIASRLKNEDYHFIFVTTGHNSANQFLDLNDEYMVHFELSQFDFNEAELMVRRRGKLVKSKRDEVVQASTRFPFDLALRQLIASKNIDPSTLNGRTISTTFDLTKKELSVLRDLSKHGINFFKLDEYIRLHSLETVNSLRDGLLISISQDGYFVIESYALFELITHVFKPIDPRTEVILILDRIRDQAEKGQLPSRRDFEIVTEHFHSIEDKSLIFELSGQVSDTAKAALEGNLVHTAWELLELATIGLERTGDFEKIADLQESLAKGFSKVNQDYFAAKSYEKAGEYFKKAEIEWRSTTNYREAGAKYVKEIGKTDTKTFHYAIRSMLKEAISCYLLANERTKAKQILEDLKSKFDEFEIHQDYFTKLEVFN